MEIVEYKLPSYLANYLINDDPSGLTHEEIIEINTYLDTHSISIVDIKEEKGFSHSNDLNHFGTDCYIYLATKKINMEEIYIVYKCDTWHTRTSYQMISICTDKDNAIESCIEYAKKEGESIPLNELAFLTQYLQTQNYSGKGEFIIECHPVNTLI